MHICFVTSEYPKEGFPHGGIGSFIQTIGQKLHSSGHKVTVVGINNYTKTNLQENDNGVNIFRLKPKVFKGLTWFLNNASINRKLKEIHNEDAISVVETAELGLAFIKKLKSVKYIIRLHGGHHFFSEAEQRGISKWKGYQEKRSFKKSDAFIAVSNYVKIHTNKYLSYHNKPIVTIRNPVNLDVFAPRIDVGMKKHAIVFAGTVCEKKGVQKLIEAMPLVMQKFPKVRLFIYGRDWFFPDGKSYISFLKEEVLSQLGKYADRIHFEGAVSLSDLSEKFAKAEVCVFPSLMETQGLVVTEAMAMQKLVINSELGPGKELVEHKVTGLLCNPYESKDIAKKLIWALNNAETCDTIRLSARKYVLSEFDTNKLINQNLNFYKSVT
ncbi:glycosyltransferase family 4 protein [Winogradskyella sp. DF17]|uniref:Glycosyltransferase family 4 protein n=1 Tax=Winogradskyella pelagia TaxID=2819984 RepID=A0ABS3T1R3_9FLAO|nr:glycosyltransferase family 4 protein [Winogradskyella sp. DF17]MBO3116682.1 glycosyltransferase family 4 protein [Winogradskyella sp. DF17]